MKYITVIILAVVIAACSTNENKRDEFFIKGNEALGAGAFEDAIEHYNNALQADSAYVPALNNRGVAYAESGNPHQAVLDYSEALRMKPDYTESRLNRAYAYEQIGQFENARQDVADLQKKSPDSAYLFFYEGLILTKLRRYKQALAAFERNLELGGDKVDAWVNMATVHFFLNQLDRAEYYLDKVFNEKTKEPNALNTQSQVLLAKGDLEGAMYAIDQALEVVPQEPYFLNNRGLIFLEMDSLERGLQDINKSILLNPDNGWAYRNKGIYFLKKGNNQRAVELLQRAEKSEEFINELYYYLGKAYQPLDRAKACEAFKKGAERGEERCRVLAEGCS